MKVEPVSTPNTNAAASVAVVVASNNWRRRTRTTVLYNHRIASFGSIVLCIALWNMRIASLMGTSSSLPSAIVGGGEVDDGKTSRWDHPHPTTMNTANKRTNTKKTDVTFTRRTITTPENVTGAATISSSPPLFFHVSPGSTGSRNLYFAT
jgi:hypothetical protein